MSPFVLMTAKAAPLLRTRCGAPLEPMRLLGLPDQTRLARGLSTGQKNGRAAPSNDGFEDPLVPGRHAFRREPLAGPFGARFAIDVRGEMDGPRHLPQVG